MIERSYDAGFLNKVVNDPSVAAAWDDMGMPGPYDLTSILNDPKNIFLANEWGGFLQINKGAGLYEIHTQFLPKGRGLKAFRAAKEAMAYMFTETDCIALITECPKRNIGARQLAEACGMTNVEQIVDSGIECDIYLITREEWKACQSH